MTERIAGHLDLREPTGFLTLYGEVVPFYEKYLKRSTWRRALEGIEGRIIQSLYKRPSSHDRA